MRAPHVVVGGGAAPLSPALSLGLFADDISCKIAPRRACSALLRGVPPLLPSPSRPCKSRRSMGLGAVGNERGLSTESLPLSSELFLAFTNSAAAKAMGRTNSCKYQQPQPGSGTGCILRPNARLFRHSTYAEGEEGAFYNPEWHGKSNLMSEGRQRF